MVTEKGPREDTGTVCQPRPTLPAPWSWTCSLQNSEKTFLLFELLGLCISSCWSELTDRALILVLSAPRPWPASLLVQIQVLAVTSSKTFPDQLI